MEVHPFVVGELALGPAAVAGGDAGSTCAHCPSVPVAEHEEVLGLVTGHDLAGSGIGWVDAHLLASALIGGTTIWTLDRPLSAVGRRLGAAG